MKASDIMTSTEVWSSADTSDARSVARLMAFHNVAAIPVLDSQGRLEGIVTDRDLCCRLIAEGRSLDTPVSELMTRPAYTIRPDTTLEEIESVMRRHKIRHLPVVDDDNMLQGFISLSDLVRHCGGTEAEHDLVGVLEAVSPATKH